MTLVMAVVLFTTVLKPCLCSNGKRTQKGDRDLGEHRVRNVIFPEPLYTSLLSKGVA